MLKASSLDAGFVVEVGFTLESLTSGIPEPFNLVLCITNTIMYIANINDVMNR